MTRKSPAAGLMPETASRKFGCNKYTPSGGQAQERIPPLDTFTEYRLLRYRDSIVDLPFTPARSRAVELINCLIELADDRKGVGRD